MPADRDHLDVSGPRLEVICGPMFAGKTTELLRRTDAAAASGLAVGLFKPSADGRYDPQAVVTHPGAARPAIPIASPGAIPEHSRGVDVVGVDEAHFFGAALIPACREILRRGGRLIVAGLERDHFGEPFEPFPWLLCEADEVIKLAGPCASCGRPAVHSQRMVDQPGRIVVGGVGAYEARCRACFRPAAAP